MSDNASSEVPGRLLRLTVLDFDSDGGNESDMETAIETVSYSWSNYRVALKTDSGLVVCLRENASDSSYAIVSGYNEGGADMGGEASRPPESSRSVYAGIDLPALTPTPSIQEFKKAISWMRDLNSGRADPWDDDQLTDLAISVADVLIDNDPNDSDAKEFIAAHASDWSPSEGDIALANEFAEELLAKVPSGISQGMEFVANASLDLSKIIEDLSVRAREIQDKNFANRLGNRVNAAQARISLTLDGIIYETSSKRKALSP